MAGYSCDALVIGAGPAGLAASRELARAGIEHSVLERGPRLGHTWANLYDSLVLHTGKHLSALPGLPFPRSTPLFPSRLDFVHYLDRYADVFRLPVRTGASVQQAARIGDAWHVRTGSDHFTARSLVIATGIVANPHVAVIAGRDRYQGAIAHSVEYRRPEPFRGARVLIVGAGNSAGEIAAEIAASGGDVTLAVRSGARVVPRELFGIPIQYFANLLAALPRSIQRAVAAGIARVSAVRHGAPVLPPPPDGRCNDIPVIGFHLVDAIRAGRVRLRPGVAELTARGARFTDGGEDEFDRVILATGYRPALDIVADAIRTDSCGFPVRRDRVTSADAPDLYFVGHTYDLRGALRNIGHDAKLAADRIGRSVDR